MGLIVNVYRDADGGNYTNGGISGQHDRLTVASMDGPFEPTDEAPAVVLIVNTPGTVALVPAVKVDGLWLPESSDSAVRMFGGNYASTSDSRFSAAIERVLGHAFYGAVPIHDRYESYAQYEALSR